MPAARKAEPGVPHHARPGFWRHDVLATGRLSVRRARVEPRSALEEDGRQSFRRWPLTYM
jgi:hypothetical protein